jgi:hypothetical protein
MASKKFLAAAAAAVFSVALAGCSSGGGHAAPQAPATGSTNTTASTKPATSSTTTTALSTQNLVVTPAVRAALLAAGAGSENLPVSDFVGLAPGRTYYAYDATTATYWAGAQLIPTSTSLPAQIASQDDGAYLLFDRSGTGAWKVTDDGVGGEPGSSCPAPVPADILALWNWPSGTCNPPPPPA